MNRGEALVRYAQSKPALTIWSQALAAEITGGGPVTVAVIPGSLTATGMVKEGFGVAGSDPAKVAAVTDAIEALIAGYPRPSPQADQSAGAAPSIRR